MRNKNTFLCLTIILLLGIGVPGITQSESSESWTQFRGEFGNGISSEKLIEDLSEIKELIIKEHQSLYLNLLVSLINKVKLFGSYFASMDIRQDSRVHNNIFN